MADRFWRGGTAAWDGTAGTKWAATVGGAGGAAVPTSADDVYFDATSTGTCTISAGNTGAKSINCTGFTGTLAGSTAITVSGSVTLVAGMTVTYSGTLTLNATGTLTTAGKTLGAVTISGSGITVTLGDALTSSSTITVTQGTFTTANYNVTATSLSSSNSNTRAINLGSSTVTLSSNSPIQFLTNTNLTFNAGTSSIVCSSSSSTIQPGPVSATGVTFYNVSLTSVFTGIHQIQSINTFNNLAVTAPSTAGVQQVSFNSRQTINGTLSTTGTAGNRRVWFQGTLYGIAQTLTINSAPSLTDADFRDIYVIGTAAPISGTRIGDLRGIRGITASTPKTVYWVTAAGGNWSGNNWAASSGGAASTDNFPLAQDTAIIENTGLNTSAMVTLDTAITYIGTLDLSTRTNAMLLVGGTAYTFHGDFKNTSSISALSVTGSFTFSGRNTQTITSAGKTFTNAITIDSYGGTVQLADALNIGVNTLTVTNGTFNTQNYNVTAGGITSSNSNVRAINLGSSTLTFGGNLLFNANTNLTFNAGTSSCIFTSQAALITGGAAAATGLTFYNVSFTSANAATNRTINSRNTFNNITVTAPSSAGLINVVFSDNQTINGTLTVAGATAVRRIFLRSSILGTTCTLTVDTLSATDCDFRDITIAGTAAGSSPTRAGDCGGNTGITFPAPKTVYWNLAGAQNWSADGWATSSGGVPATNNFPLAQDTAVFDNTGSVTGTITINAAWNIGTFDASARTSAMTLTTSTNAPIVYGDWKFGTGVTSSSTTGTITFATRGTKTITSNGVTFGCPITINCVTGTVNLADAMNMGSSRLLNLASGTFDAVSYNVTIGYVVTGTASNATVKLGSGTWTISGDGSVFVSVWDLASAPVLYKGTANIVLSDTSTSARTFNGGGLSYNKLTIGGATGTSTLTISGNNQFTELASTKTVAHTIALGTTTQTFGAWTVTGTSGNVVTLTGTGTSHILAGACTSGIDYLAMGSIGFAATSPGEFYAGANSTGTAAAPVYRTVKPADSTRYWVGGTGNWSDTARWSTSSGGASGAAVPRSHDDVVFNSASNATAYTATVNAVTGGIRCKALTIAGPASGNLTLAGSTAIVGIHGDVTLPATGLTRTYTGAITLSGSATGRTFTTNGVTLASLTTVNGVGCGWALGSALNISIEALTVTNGSFDLVTYNLTCGNFLSTSSNKRTVIFGSATVTLQAGTLDFGTTASVAADLIFSSGTYQINVGGDPSTFQGNNQTFNNVSFTTANIISVTLSGANTFNNVSIAGRTTAGISAVVLNANQTINGTLTLSAGTNATCRTFVRSDTIGTTRTLTCAAVASLTDIDFRDITIAGAAAPVSGTRLGDAKGNSGITFPAAKTVYWRAATSANWASGSINWSLTDGGTGDVNYFPLAQDTCVFATYPNSGFTSTINANYNIGTIDMSLRTTNTVTLATGTTTPGIYGNWINGTGTTLSGTGTMTFAGRGSQTITSAGKPFTQPFTINTLSGSVTLQDALNLTGSNIVLTSGTIDAASYNVTFGGLTVTGALQRTLAFGSGNWTLLNATTPFNAGGATNLTVTGTGTINLTSASAKTFNGGGISYTDITLNQGGNGALTILGNNTFKTISSTAAGANTINIGTTTQTITTSWTAAGTAGNILTVQGASASSPGTLVFTGSGTAANVDYLTITGVRAYPL